MTIKTEHVIEPARLAAGSTYAVSGGLVVGDITQWFTEWAAAIGVILAVMTFILNWHYKRQELRVIRAKLEAEINAPHNRRHDDPKSDA